MNYDSHKLLQSTFVGLKCIEEHKAMPKAVRETLDAIAPARKTDPATSHAAADSLNLPRLEARVLEAIRWFGVDGCIADQIVEFTIRGWGMDWRTATPRIAPLIRKGLVVDTGTTRPGASGRRQRVVRAV